MHKVFAGLFTVLCVCSVALAQNAQPQPRPQPRPAAGQATQPAAGQATQPGRVVGQPAQPGTIQPVQPGRVTTQPGTLTPGQPAQGGQHASADQQIAACVYGECHNEIEIAKLAESKAQSEEVRDFAQKMVSDHTPGCQEMQRLAGQLVSDTHGEQAHQPQRGAAGGQLDWVSIHKEVGQQCLKSVKQELSSKQGIEFDKCFMGQQIGAHMKVVDSLTVLRNHASSDLQQKLDQELQTAKQHLQLAKQIEQKLKETPSERVSRRPESKQ